MPGGDLDDDCVEMLLDEQFMAHDTLMAEALANGEGAANIVRYSAARKFNREDPIEAASAQMILQYNKQ